MKFGARGTYREVIAPERVVHTERMEGLGDGVDGEALCTLTLVESSGRTTLSHTMLFPSKEARDQALQTGMTDGMAMSYDRMEAVMKEKVG